jgi:hypothetical protein
MPSRQRRNSAGLEAPFEGELVPRPDFFRACDTISTRFWLTCRIRCNSLKTNDRANSTRF